MHELHIVADEAQFLGKRPCKRPLSEDRTKALGQLNQHFSHTVGTIQCCEPANGRNGIVQKVWIDLGLQRAQLKLQLLVVVDQFLPVQLFDAGGHFIELAVNGVEFANVGADVQARVETALPKGGHFSRDFRERMQDPAHPQGIDGAGKNPDQ